MVVSGPGRRPAGCSSTSATGAYTAASRPRWRTRLPIARSCIRSWQRIEAEITLGSFNYALYFPNNPLLEMFATRLGVGGLPNGTRLPPASGRQLPRRKLSALCHLGDDTVPTLPSGPPPAAAPPAPPRPGPDRTSILPHSAPSAPWQNTTDRAPSLPRPCPVFKTPRRAPRPPWTMTSWIHRE